MPEYLRALVAICALAIPVFVFAKAPACALASSAADFERRRNLWFALTLAAFLAHNFWVYVLLAAALLYFGTLKETNRLALYFFLLLALPRIEDQITGLGLIEHVFTIHYLRLLSLVILLPAFLSLRARPDAEPFGRSLPDKLLAGFLILNFVLMLTVNSLTNTLRNAFFYAFIDIFLPYYVASRALKKPPEFRDALMGFVVGAMVMSAIAVFEYGKGWLLYSSLEEALGRPWNQTYLMRGDSLRAQATAGQPIPLGLALAVAAGLFLYVRTLVCDPIQRHLGALVLAGGLIATWSRGPWAGAALMLLVFLASGRAALKTYAGLAVLSIVGLPVLLATPYGDSLIDLLPFVGTIDAHNVTYRQKLMAIGIEVVLQNLWFGAYNFYLLEELQQLKQGQGIIDVVNTYLAVALEKGLVGLFIFLGFFISIAHGLMKALRSAAEKSGELQVLGRALLATLLGVLLTIFTCSNVGLVPVICYSVAGLGVAYLRMLAPVRHGEPAPAASAQPARG
jgi:hypothetical protein